MMPLMTCSSTCSGTVCILSNMMAVMLALRAQMQLVLSLARFT